MHLLFDLDGTLTDSFLGISRSIQYAFAALGLPEPPDESLRGCIGPPLKQSFTTLLGPKHAHLLEAATDLYRERFSSVGLFENEVYPTIEDTLKQLQECGHILHVATSKLTIFADRIIEHFELSKYFISINGSELDGTRSDKRDLIAHILKIYGIDPNQAVMIGDREHDIIGARKNGVAGLGVCWGYGSREELAAAGAYACVTTPAEIPEALTKKPANE